jgi:hypothetical protein
MMKRISVLYSIVMLAGIGIPVQAAENYGFLCTHDGSQRKIEVIYLQADKRVPCEVRYVKDSVSQLLWNARREEGYCELMTDAFIEKQKAWGWSCNRDIKVDASPESITDG